jgi:hypothetical protein
MSKRVTIVTVGFIMYATFQLVAGSAAMAWALQLWSDLAAGKWGDVQRLLGVLGS